jgi:hypothetical protein
MLSDDLQDLGDVDLLTIAVPPALLTMVTRIEENLSPVREDVLDLHHVRF